MTRMTLALFPVRFRRWQQAAFCLGALTNLLGWWYVA